MMRVVFAILCLAASAATWGQTAIFKDRFLRTAAPGDLAIVPERVDHLASTQKLLPLTRNGTQVFKHRATCIMAIAHRDPDQSNVDTFVGIQLIKVFRTHATPGVIHVVRNGIWFSRDGGQLLAEQQPTEVAVKAMADFAAAHLTRTTLESLLYTDGKRKVATSWHARLSSTKDSDYSADDQFVRFWQVDPTAERIFRDAYPELLRGDPPIRIENRLLSFKMTDSSNPSRMPSFNFDCNDPSLNFVAIKTYLPFASDVAWTYLRFQ